MTNKWIEEIKEVFVSGRNLDDIVEVCERINKLLRRAMHSTDDNSLYDDIRKEIKNDKKD